jgi:hypothetical protein
LRRLDFGAVMNCQSVQNRILALPDPRQVPDNLRAHLDACPDCLRWWNQAARLEALLEQLPAPPAPGEKKEALIDELTAAGPVIKRIPALERRSAPSPLVALLRRNWKPLAGLAAGVLVVLGGWWALRPGNNGNMVQATPPHPLLAKVVQWEVALTKADTPAKRLEGLGGLADTLQLEALNLARVASGDELNDLAGWYEKVVKNGIVERAVNMPEHALTRTEREALLSGLANKLAEAGQEVERVAREAPPQSQPALKRIADSARDGQKKLRQLAAEA